MKIMIAEPRDGGLLLCGVPLPQGAHAAGSGFVLHDMDGEPLLLWWEERGWWPDGTIKWIFLHARLSAASETVTLSPEEAHPAALDSKQLQGPAAGLARVGLDGLLLEIGADRWVVRRNGCACAFRPAAVRTEPGLEQAGPCVAEVVQASAVAPLVRVRQDGPAGLRLDHLIRLDPVSGSIEWQQRLSFLTETACELQGVVAVLEFGTVGEWRWDVDGGVHTRVLVPAPGEYAVDGGSVHSGWPPVSMRGAAGSVELVKGWQRAPCGLAVDGGHVRVDLYPDDVASLTVQPGTSFRHALRVGLACEAERPAAWRLEPEAACASGAFGPLMARAPQTQRLFAGYEQAMNLCMQGGRLQRLDKQKGDPPGPAAPLYAEEQQDTEYFGLQHYGDWPMRLGAYGGEQRMYADNEYDTPYAYYLQFIRTGEAAYQDVAYWSAVHMADVDSKATDGDMRFHGYRETAEDHAAHRPDRGDLGHYWTDGLVLNYLLADDLFAWEAALAQTRWLLERFAGEGDEPVRRHFLGCERAVGWPLTALAGVAEITGDRDLLAKMAQMAGYLARFTADPDRELQELNTVDGLPVRWWRVCQEDGSKPFMLGVVLEGLERYHRLTRDPAAQEAVANISGFLVDVMWTPGIEAFIYEWNAFNRGHRESNYPHYINMMVAPGLAFAYELTGDERFRDIATRAFHAALWTLVAPGGGKEIGMVGRTSSLMVGRLHKWWCDYQKTRARRMRPSSGCRFRFAGPPQKLVQRQDLLPREGSPRFVDGALRSDADSFLVLGFREPVNTDRGTVEFTVTPDWDCPPHPGPVAQRGYVHLSDRSVTRSCVSIISFYTGLHVRFYDAERHYVEVLETDIQHWRAGEPHRVRIQWDVDQAEAMLWMDGEEADRRPLLRRLGGGFKRLHVGHRPGNWRANGLLADLRLNLG